MQKIKNRKGAKTLSLHCICSWGLFLYIKMFLTTLQTKCVKKVITVEQV